MSPNRRLLVTALFVTLTLGAFIGVTVLDSILSAPVTDGVAVFTLHDPPKQRMRLPVACVLAFLGVSGFIYRRSILDHPRHRRMMTATIVLLGLCFAYDLEM